MQRKWARGLKRKISVYQGDMLRWFLVNFRELGVDGRLPAPAPCLPTPFPFRTGLTTFLVAGPEASPCFSSSAGGRGGEGGARRGSREGLRWRRRTPGPVSPPGERLNQGGWRAPLLVAICHSSTGSRRLQSAFSVLATVSPSDARVQRKGCREGER